MGRVGQEYQELRNWAFTKPWHFVALRLQLASLSPGPLAAKGGGGGAFCHFAFDVAPSEDSEALLPVTALPEDPTIGVKTSG